MEVLDAVVLGAGPAGLAAGLSLARAGARVAVVEAGDEVGGLCRTVARHGFLYDLGGHILFVRHDERLAWLRDLVGDDLVWVDRPVASVAGGRVEAGRYLDRRPAGFTPNGDGAGCASGLDFLAVRAGGREWVDRWMRPYLEKIDGLPLERIPAARVERLLVGQAAPDGFWFCRWGIGRLMQAMADATVAAGGRVHVAARATALRVGDDGVEVDVEGHRSARAEQLVVAVAPHMAARLLRPAPPPPLVAPLPMRAVCLVYLALDRDRLTEEPWIQVDDPAVPFARLAEMRNWSADMAPRGRTVLCAECYCRADGADPVWSLTDDALGAACARALHDPLGLAAEPVAWRLLEVVRLPQAYPVVAVDEVERAVAPARHLAGLPGVEVAQGGAVVEAIDAGEAAAARIVAAAR
ncbi:MAG: FAD-dependent oxidoreductase [Actinomycetota bacterium]